MRALSAPSAAPSHFYPKAWDTGIITVKFVVKKKL